MSSQMCTLRHVSVRINNSYLTVNFRTRCCQVKICPKFALSPHTVYGNRCALGQGLGQREEINVRGKGQSLIMGNHSLFKCVHVHTRVHARLSVLLTGYSAH